MRAEQAQEKFTITGYCPSQSQWHVWLFVMLCGLAPWRKCPITWAAIKQPGGFSCFSSPPERLKPLLQTSLVKELQMDLDPAANNATYSTVTGVPWSPYFFVSHGVLCNRKTP